MVSHKPDWIIFVRGVKVLEDCQLSSKTSDLLMDPFLVKQWFSNWPRQRFGGHFGFDGGMGGDQNHRTYFGVTQHPKQASGGISHSSRAERKRLCVKMESRNTGSVTETNMADGLILALCFTAAQISISNHYRCCTNTQFDSLGLFN